MFVYRFDTVEHSGKDAYDVKQAYLLAGEDLTNNLSAIAPQNVVSASYSGTGFANAGAATKANQKASPGMIRSLRASNQNAALRYLQIHNKATAPAGADTAVFSFAIPAGTSAAPGVTEIGAEFLGLVGYYLSTGIGWAISTTSGTFTDSATAAEHNVNGIYV